MKEKELISDHVYHQWKKHDCTVAVLSLLDDAIERAELTIQEHVKQSDKIDMDFLYTTKGALFELHEIKHTILHKEELEVMSVEIEEEDENI